MTAQYYLSCYYLTKPILVTLLSQIADLELPESLYSMESNFDPNIVPYPPWHMPRLMCPDQVPMALVSLD
jgi:hypothetical protein